MVRVIGFVEFVPVVMHDDSEEVPARILAHLHPELGLELPDGSVLFGGADIPPDKWPT
jgi:hypothetical protein